jgi:hypothetical protein
MRPTVGAIENPPTKDEPQSKPAAVASDDDEGHKLAHLLCIVGEDTDRDFAMAVLTSVGGNIERAIECILDGVQPSLAPQAAPAGILSTGEQVLSVPEMRMLLDAHGVDYSGCRKRDELADLFQKTFNSNQALPVLQPPQRNPSKKRSASADLRKQLADEEWRAEKAAQDEEYHEALLIDQQREAAREAEAAAKAKEEEAQRVLVEQAERAQAQRQEALEAKRKIIAQPELPRTDPDSCQVAVRIPSGRRLIRVFRSSDTVSMLYDWLDVSCDGEGFAKVDYMLISQVPGQLRQELTERPRSLKEEGLGRQCMLFVACNE